MTSKASLDVLATVAFKQAYLELVPAFEREAEIEVVTQWVPTIDLIRRLEAGETCDLVAMAASSIDALINRGVLVRGSRIDFASSGIGIAVRVGIPPPDVATTKALTQALLGARTIAYSTGPSGAYLSELFDRMGLATKLAPKVRQSTGEAIGDVVARGDADIGFQQVSELLPVPGINYLGPLPADIQRTTVFASAVHAKASQPDAAKVFSRRLAAAHSAPALHRAGLQPI